MCVCVCARAGGGVTLGSSSNSEPSFKIITSIRTDEKTPATWRNTSNTWTITCVCVCVCVYVLVVFVIVSVCVSYLCLSPCALLDQTAGHGGGHSVALEEPTDWVTDTQSHQFLWGMGGRRETYYSIYLWQKRWTILVSKTTRFVIIFEKFDEPLNFTLNPKLQTITQFMVLRERLRENVPVGNEGKEIHKIEREREGGRSICCTELWSLCETVWVCMCQHSISRSGRMSPHGDSMSECDGTG